jgi:hypothetical protein
MKIQLRSIKNWFSGRASSPEGYEGVSEWFDQLFFSQAEKMGIDLENPTSQQLEDMEHAYDKALSTVSDMLAAKLIEAWEKQSKRELKKDEQKRRGVEQRLLKIWNNPIRKLEMFRSVCLATGISFNSKYRNEAAASQSFVYDALNRLHAHACLIAAEIIVLLRHGFAHGAYSRWRTLHEINVTASFIFDHGDEVAERYLLHDQIQAYDAAMEYQEAFDLHREYFTEGGHEPIDDETLEQLTKLKNELCNRFGDEYARRYGWAAEALDDRSPTFKKIEAVTDFSKLRPFYRLASQSVHASPQGILRTLGHPPSETDKSPYQRIMLAGPSIFGLVEPGQGAAIALLQITITFMSWKAQFSEIVYKKALSTLCSDVVDTFIETNDELKRMAEETETQD